jgi:RND family efflux transporter MFP subunit
MKIMRIAVIGLLLSMPVLLWGCNSKVSSATKESEKSMAHSVVKVRTAKPVLTSLSHVLNYTGTIQPRQEVRISPETMGKIKKIHVEEGDSVKKGQLLITFDTKLSALQKSQAAAAVKLAEVQVKTLQKEVDRLQPLLESGAISAGEFDKLSAQHDAAQAQLNQAKAAEALSGYQLKVSRIQAPFAGVVARKLVNEGEVIAPGALGPYGMITLMDLDAVKVQVGVGEKDIPSIMEGQDASVTVDAYPGETFTGTVVNIAPAADPMSKAFPVDIEIPNEDMRLKAGMFAKVGIQLQTKENVLAVPEDAILDEKEGKVLFFVEKDNTVKKLDVETGIESEGLVEILGQKLDPSREVVVEGNFGLRDGAKILKTD